MLNHSNRMHTFYIINIYNVLTTKENQSTCKLCTNQITRQFWNIRQHFFSKSELQNRACPNCWHVNTARRHNNYKTILFCFKLINLWYFLLCSATCSVCVSHRYFNIAYCYISWFTFSQKLLKSMAVNHVHFDYYVDI